jgi:hypothetical protein
VVAYNKEVTDVGVADGRVAPPLLAMFTDEGDASASLPSTTWASCGDCGSS